MFIISVQNHIKNVKDGVIIVMQKFLAFDFGAESGRAMLGTIENDKIVLREIHRFMNRQVKIHGRIYWDILYLFDELKKGLKIAAQQEHGEIRSVAIDTWGVDYAFIDSAGRLLANPVAYRDERTNGMMEKVFKKVSKKEIYRHTGIQFMQLNTLFQLFSYYGENNPQIKVSERLIMLPDLFSYFLTGKVFAEYTIASTTQLLDARSKTWAKPLFKKLGIPVEIMPTVIEPTSVIGVVDKEIAEETAIGAVSVVAAAGHDTACAVAAVPADSENWAYLSSGTWSLLGVEIKEPIINDLTLQYGFTNEGGVNGTIRLLKNTMGLWLLQRCRKSWTDEGNEFDYDELVRLAAEAEPFRSIINPDDAGFLNPPDMPAAIQAFCKHSNQPLPQTVGQYVRLIFESLALKYRGIIERLNGVLEKPIEVLHIVGGGSQNEMLNQFAANATGLTVKAGPVEATALGNVMMQAIAGGAIAGAEEGRKIIARSFPVKTFYPQDRNIWEKKYKKVENLF